MVYREPAQSGRLDFLRAGCGHQKSLNGTSRRRSTSAVPISSRVVMFAALSRGLACRYWPMNRLKTHTDSKTVEHALKRAQPRISLRRKRLMQRLPTDCGFAR